jgi:hypothetical protein
MNHNFSKYPICDTDMWVYLYLSDFLGRILQRYEKLVFADVVEQEILAWEENNERYKDIAVYFKQCKEDGVVLVIQHEVHIDKEDRGYLEQTLRDLHFSNGLKNHPKERNKGEFVSALYADHFEMPFIKSNDNAFQVGGIGQKAFPELKVKNWYDIVEEFSVSQDEKIRIRKIVDKEQKQMTYFYEKQKEEKKKQDMLKLLAEKVNKGRLK